MLTALCIIGGTVYVLGIIIFQLLAFICGDPESTFWDDAKIFVSSFVWPLALAWKLFKYYY
jgi:hypothetical protein